MARSVQVTLRGDDSQLQAAVARVSSRLEAAGRKWEAIGRRLSLTFAAPLAAFGAIALRTSGEFEAAMNRVQALSGASAAEFKGLEQQARKLGAATQFSAAQAADAMGFLAMSGMKANQIMGAMPATLQLAAAAKLDMARAADIVTNILTGYGLEVQELGRANDVLVKAFTSSNTSLEQLGEAFKYVGPVARGAGFEFEETVATLAMMGNAGIQASMAGTALRGAITRLLKPTAEVQRTLRQLGVRIKDANGQLLPMIEILEQLERAGADTGHMVTIFGRQAGPALTAVLAQGTDALRRMVLELRDSGGTAERVAATQMRGLKGAIEELKSAFEELQLAIAKSGLQQWAEKAAREGANLIRVIAGVDAALLKVGTAVGLLTVALPTTLLLTGAFARALVAVRDAAALLAGVSGLTGVAVTLSAGGPLMAGLALLGTMLFGARLQAERTRQAMKKLREEWEEKRPKKTPAELLEDLKKLDKALLDQARLVAQHERTVARYTDTRFEREAVENLENARRKLGQIILDRAKTRAQLENLQILPGITVSGADLPPPLDDKTQKRAERIGDAIEQLNARLRTSAGLTRLLGDAHDAAAAEASAYQTAIQELLTLGVEPSDERLQAYAARLQELRQRQKEVEETTRRQKDLQSEVAGILERIRTPQERYNEQVARLNELLSQGALNHDQFRRAVRLAEDELAKVGARGEDSLEHLRDAVVRLRDTFANAMADMLVTGQGTFRRFADSAIRELARVAIVAGIKKIGEGLLSGGGGGMPGRPTGFAAQGANVRPGEAWWVGERGPELFFPGVSGQVRPVMAAPVSVRLTVDTSSLPPLPRPMTPREAARDGWWREVFSHLRADHVARGGR